jgi:hypothetical protein
MANFISTRGVRILMLFRMSFMTRMITAFAVQNVDRAINQTKAHLLQTPDRLWRDSTTTRTTRANVIIREVSESHSFLLTKVTANMDVVHHFDLSGVMSANYNVYTKS